MATELSKLTDAALKRKLEKFQRQWARHGSMASLIHLEEYEAETRRRARVSA